jgi:hypothetical protein
LFPETIQSIMKLQGFQWSILSNLPWKEMKGRLTAYVLLCFDDKYYISVQQNTLKPLMSSEIYLTAILYQMMNRQGYGHG